MTSPASWLIAFLVASATAGTLLVGGRTPAAPAIVSRDPAKLAAVDAELILNRIREGDLLAIKGDRDGARALWKEALRQGTGYWPIHEAVGDSLLRHRFDAEAAAEYDRAARIAFEQLGRAPIDLAVKRAALHLRAKRPEAALPILLECGDPVRLAAPIAAIVRETPALLKPLKEFAAARDPRLWAIVATTSEEAGERASALGKYTRGVAPDDGRLAIAKLREVGKIDEAILVASDWAKAAPSNPEAYEAWGRLLVEKGDRDRGKLILSTIVDVKAGDPAAHLRLGDLLRELGDFPEAIRQFETVSRLRPDEPSGAQEVILTLLAKGDTDAATSAYEKLVKGPWHSRFGDVASGLRPRIADMVLPRIEVLRKAGDTAGVVRLRTWCGELGITQAGLYDIKIVLRWNAASDVDLDVLEPDGSTVNHGHSRSKCGAVYLYDNTQGHGPEHYLLHKGVPGKYRVGVHLHGGTPSVAEVEVILFEETPRERRLKATVTLGGSVTAAWPLDFEFP